MQKLKLFIITVVTSFAVLPLASFMHVAKAAETPQSDNSAACDLRGGSKGNLVPDSKANSPDCSDNDDDDTINNIIKMAIRIFQVIVGVIATFFVIYGGLTYITSGGSDAGIKTAKNTLLYAAIGLLVVGIAQVFVGFVLNRVSDATE